MFDALRFACCLAPLQHGGFELDALDRELLEGVGIVLENPAPPCTTANGVHTRSFVFDTSGLGARVHDFASEPASSRLRFEPLAELGEREFTPAECSTCGWNGGVSSTPPRTLGFDAPRVAWTPSVHAIVQTPGTTTATGSVAITSFAGPLRVSNVRSGCGMTHLPASAFDLGETPLTLESRVDLHNLLRADNLCVSLQLADGERIGIPFSLELTAPPFELSGAGDFVSAPDSTSSLTLTPLTGAIRAVTITSLPACLDVTGWEGRAERFTIDVATANVARTAHACAPLRGTIELVGDARPFAFAFTPRHDGEVVDAAGRPLVYGVFIPGETVVLAPDDSGALRRAHPQRIAALGDLWPIDRATAITWTVPTDARGPLDLVTRSNDGAHEFHVVGAVSAELSSRRDVWLSLGR